MAVEPPSPQKPATPTKTCCRSSVVEHSLGKGEADSSILSGSTIRPQGFQLFPHILNAPYMGPVPKRDLSSDVPIWSGYFERSTARYVTPSLGTASASFRWWTSLDAASEERR